MHSGLHFSVTANETFLEPFEHFSPHTRLFLMLTDKLSFGKGIKISAKTLPNEGFTIARIF
jgi:hypothetical protein